MPNTNASTGTAANATDVRDLSCIRDFKNDIVSKLKTLNITGLGQNVFANRVSKVWPEEETCCIVNIPESKFEDNRSSPRFYIASGDVIIAVYGRSFFDDEGNAVCIEDESDVCDLIEDVARQIVEYLETNVEVGRGKEVNRFYLKSMANNFSVKDAVRGACVMTFGFEFSVVINWTAPTDEFLKAKNTLTAGEGAGNKQEFTTNVRPL